MKTDTYKDVVTLAERLIMAEAWEAAAKIEGRNSIAQSIFSNPDNRKVRGPHGLTVETWYDRKSRAYITQTLHDSVTEVHPAEYSGNPEDAAVAHLRALQHLLDADRLDKWLSTMEADTGFSRAKCERALTRFKRDYHAAECFLTVCNFLQADVDTTLTQLGLMGMGVIPGRLGPVKSEAVQRDKQRQLPVNATCPSCGKMG